MLLKLLFTFITFALSVAADEDYNPPPLPDLLPWEVTYLKTWSPSGRPGTYPFSHIELTIRDPNNLTLGWFYGDRRIGWGPSSANCSLKWLRDIIPSEGYNESIGYLDKPFACHPTNGVWEVSYLPTTKYPLSQFNLKFAAWFVVVLKTGGLELFRWEGEGRFASGFRGIYKEGDNMGGGGSSSGGSSYTLRPEYTPVKIQQHLVRRACLNGNCIGHYYPQTTMTTTTATSSTPSATSATPVKSTTEPAPIYCRRRN